ncbi:MAG: hypothetical protein HY865_23125 [Chloroflexi bacterium]|nr:hypothetical protein [Chloroflexota bacterium]
MDITIFLLIVFCFILIAVTLSNWRKIVNPVIKFGHEILIVSRKKEYLPPKIFIEGYGIKRGLSPAEAALISEKPFNEILGIMLSDALAKSALVILSTEPLKFETDKLLPDTLNRDERDFVRICIENNVKKRQEKLANLMIRMIRTLSNKMKGFSLPETVSHYATIVETAIEKVRHENIQTLVYKLVDDMDEFTKTITKATNPYKDAPVFKEEPAYMKFRARGGYGGGSYIGRGGGGCACACACAGCACACAGGGR